MILCINKHVISVLADETLVAGSDKSYLATFVFDDSWNGLTKTAVFQAGERTQQVSISSDNQCIVPAACLEIPGLTLKVLVYGIQNGEETTTSWCSISRILYRDSFEDIGRGGSMEQITGLPGQVIGFNEQGQPIAQDPSELGFSAGLKEYGPIEKLAPYTYCVSYSDIDYENANQYFQKYKPEIGACSVIVNGDIIGRNYDWKYSHRCSFITFTPAVKGRHAVIGVSSGTPNLTEAFVDSGESSDDYKVLPFELMDGLNDAGLFAEINVVPAGDMGITTGTNPDGEDLYGVMIPRYVLDYASSVDEAISLLEGKNIYCADAADTHEEFHFLLSDKEKTVVIEFVDNEMVVIDEFVNDKPISTNFYLTGFDGTKASLTPHAAGIERYAILSEGYGSVFHVSGMQKLMESVKYTLAYSEDEDPIWYSEFNGNYPGFGDLTINSAPEDYDEILAYVRGLYDNRSRDDSDTWQTVHMSVYDRENHTLFVRTQEQDKTFGFRLKIPGQIDSSRYNDDLDILSAMKETGIIDPVVASGTTFYTDSDNRIYTL